MGHYVDAGYDSLAAGRNYERSQHADGSGLAGAVGAEQAENFPVMHLQVEFVHGQHIAGIKLGQPLAANGRLGLGYFRFIRSVDLRRHYHTSTTSVPESVYALKFILLLPQFLCKAMQDR
jgi:hypothetical protein